MSLWSIQYRAEVPPSCHVQNAPVMPQPRALSELKKKDFKKTVQFNPSAAPPTGILCPNSMPLVKLSLLKKT